MKRTGTLLILSALVFPGAGICENVAIDFSLQPRDIESVCASAIGRSDNRLEALERRPPERLSFGVFLPELDGIVSDLRTESAAATFLKYVSTDKAVRDASRACEKKIEMHKVDIFSRRALYKQIKKIEAQASENGPEAARLLSQTVKDYERNGHALGAIGSARVRLFRTMLIELKDEFGRNLSNEDVAVFLSPQDLQGLPNSYVDHLEKARFGTRKVTLDQKDYFPFMRDAAKESARRRLDILMKNRANPENVVLLEEILSLRRRMAQLLGYKSYAHLILEDRIAGDPKTVSKFLRDLRRRITRKGKAELAEMTALKREDIPEAEDFFSWDFFYYDKRLRTARRGLDDEKIQEHFPLDRVVDKMLEVSGAFLGISFKEITPAAAWHPDVRQFEITEGGKLLGRFYTDLRLRDGKYKHAAAFMLVEGYETAPGDYRVPVAALVTNFDRPKGDKPSLLRHGEVETLFHEFGHILHQTLSRAKYARFGATRVSRDFRETPSQLLELWVWDKDVLKKISSHYQTGAPLPDADIDRLIASKNLNSGLRYLRQIFYGTIDQLYHSGPPNGTTESYRKLYDEIGLIRLAPETYPQAGFGYLMGYASGYYGYLWSEIYSADIASLFAKSGLLSPQLGYKYRKEILEPGAYGDPASMLKAFLGREPSQDAFLKSIGAGR